MKRVIVADDVADITDFLKEVLQGYYSVDVAETGREVLYKCKQEHYDVVILDVEFKNDIDGIKIASVLRERNKEIRIIICSAHELSLDNERMIQLINAAFLLKPLTLEAIQRIIDEE